MNKLTDIIRKYGRTFKAFLYRRKYKLLNASKKAYYCGPLNVSPDLVLEDFTYIGPHCRIYPNVTIKKFTILANNVSIIGGDHRYDVVGLPVGLTGRSVIPPTVVG